LWVFKFHIWHFETPITFYAHDGDNTNTLKSSEVHAEEVYAEEVHAEESAEVQDVLFL
jgi:hypothetical protein